MYINHIYYYDCTYHLLPPAVINCGNAYSMSNWLENCPKSRRKVHMAGVSRESDSLWGVLWFVKTKTSAPNVQQSFEMNPSEWRWKVRRERNFAKPTSVPLSNRLNAPALSVQPSTFKFKVGWVQILLAISTHCQLILSGIVSKRVIHMSLGSTANMLSRRPKYVLQLMYVYILIYLYINMCSTQITC